MTNAIVRGTHRFLLAVLILALVATAAQADTASYEERVARATRGSMMILAGWSATNLVIGTTLWLTTDDPVLAAFHQMNAGWNIVNAALAVPGLISSTRDLASIPSGRTQAEIRAQQNRLEDTLLFNAGIDVGYMMAGAYLMERARRGEADADMLDGFGRSLILQGGFLFAFDLAAYFVQRSIAPDS